MPVASYYMANGDEAGLDDVIHGVLPAAIFVRCHMLAGGKCDGP